MAAELMDHKVSECDVMRAVQAIQPTATLAYRRETVITGLVGALMLREPAVDLLMRGDFDAADVDLDLLAGPGEAPAIGYGWGIAASTKTAGEAVMAFGVELMQGPLAELGMVCRAVTPVGRHVCMTRFGYRPLRHPDDGMLIRPARTSGALP
ncbi:MAG: hypothetical protein ACHP7N_00845 [Caulobacterales bacterium]